MSNSTLNYLIMVCVYYYYTYILQISLNAINNVPELGQNLGPVSI